MLTDLADVLRGAGLTVVEAPGWKTRGYLRQEMSGVRAIITHWTGSNPAARGDYPTLGTILAGTDETPGPLSQLGLGRGGTWYVCAAGLCNHAGVVDSTDHSNPWAIGIEAEYHPDQGPWPEVQQRSFERGCAALARHYRVPVDQIRGHYEVARPAGRKPDPATLPGGMPGFRTRTASILEDDMPNHMNDIGIRNHEGKEVSAQAVLNSIEAAVKDLRDGVNFKGQRVPNEVIGAANEGRVAELQADVAGLKTEFSSVRDLLAAVAKKVGADVPPTN